MHEWENKLWGIGLKKVAGVDEVGRGCLFGDVIAAAVILPPYLIIDGVRDSKTVTPHRRSKLYDTILEHALAVGIGRVDAAQIDRINIKQASRLAMKLAVEDLAICPDHILTDSERLDSSLPVTPIVHGDQVSHTIAAASIIAKVTRDRLCEHWDLEYPDYGISQHKGYGTALHRERILEYGLSPMHRKRFCRHIGFQLTLF